MNVEKILAVADAIENRTIKGLGFYMPRYVDRSGCGTAACVAGWAVVLEHGLKALNVDQSYNIPRDAAEILELEELYEIDDLFCPPSHEHPCDRVDIVADELRNIAKSGVVDPEWWERVLERAKNDEKGA